ncbi:HNH endonuclease [Fimbriiglobus ruber]|uniref:HNH nuclease domain-containing protein n=1 Tax=Fimbriiglobus ruber TaxID=1908690 RepID=A0A225DME3_9BACT|nr:HNH endonuclease [Fimbriiglobus ruber]OWK42183.1 hypothetical protein FRUB_04261 [Fimbriiglobus ruber]
MKPTAERVRSLLVYNPSEIKTPFAWQAWFKFHPWENPKDHSGIDREGFLQIRIDGQFYRADQLAWLFMTGEWPQHEISHADGEKLNNSWGNIQEKAAPAAAA